MSTIRLKRSDKLAIHLEFDFDGARVILNSLKAAANGTSKSMLIEFDRSIAKKKQVPATSQRMMTIFRSAVDSLEEIGDCVNFKFESDTLDYAIERFEKCVATNEFNPAELCELSVIGGRNADQDLYCILIK